jgi:hypothetical protein
MKDQAKALSFKQRTLGYIQIMGWIYWLLQSSNRRLIVGIPFRKKHLRLEKYNYYHFD